MAYDFKSLTKQADEASNRGKFYTDFEDVDPNVLHQISDLTEWIRTKGKGSDVREIIAQLFERTWLEATKEGNANMEVAQARGVFETLSDRLKNGDSELSKLIGDIERTDSRIDNIIATASNGSTPTELTDMRNSQDGYSFPTARQSIEYQLKNNTLVEDIVRRAEPTRSITDFTSSANSQVWSFDKKFPQGFVKSVRINILAESAVPIQLGLVGFESAKLLKVINTTGTGIVDIPINDFIGEDFYLTVGAYMFAFGKPSQKVRYAAYSNMTLKEGTGYEPAWKDGNYIPAMEVVYKDLNSQISDLIKAQPIVDTANTAKATPKSRDFDDLKEPGNYWFSVSRNQDDPLKNAPRNATYGNYAVFVSQFSPITRDTKFLMQLAVSYGSETGKGVYVRYLLVNGDGSIDDADKNIRTWLPLYDEEASKSGAEVTNYTRNELFIAGDSITAGHPYENENDLHWPVQVAKNLGYNLTRGARNGAGWLHLSGTTNAIKIVNDNDFSLYNVAVFAFGTNDYGNNIPLGTVDDLYPSQQTVLGAMNYVIKKIYEKNPKITLIISTPLNRLNAYPSNFVINENGGYGSRNGVGYTLSELTDKMIEVCQKYGILYIDNRQSPFNLLSMSSLLGDRLHPNRDGYQILGQYLSARIGSLIRPYAD